MSRADQDRQALRRIAAQLLGLAHFAERASLRSLPIRFLLFWILRPAEAYARNLVADALRDLGAQANTPEFLHDIAPMISGNHANRACDVLRLALTFEMLAAVLEALGEWVVARGRPFASAEYRRPLSESAPTSALRGFEADLRIEPAARSSAEKAGLIAKQSGSLARAPPPGLRRGDPSAIFTPSAWSLLSGWTRGRRPCHQGEGDHRQAFAQPSGLKSGAWRG